MRAAATAVVVKFSDTDLSGGGAGASAWSSRPSSSARRFEPLQLAKPSRLSTLVYAPVPRQPPAMAWDFETLCTSLHAVELFAEKMRASTNLVECALGWALEENALPSARAVVAKIEKRKLDAQRRQRRNAILMDGLSPEDLGTRRSTRGAAKPNYKEFK